MNGYLKSMPFNMIHLCIDEWYTHQSGDAYNTTLVEPIYFHDILDFILKMDDVFNKNGNPLSSHLSRSFQKQDVLGLYQNHPHIVNDYCQYNHLNGKIGTFDIIVKSRRQSSWQGIIYYGKQQKSFHNILELIFQIDSFLRKSICKYGEGDGLAG